jgi:prophage regulatory protein
VSTTKILRRDRKRKQERDEEREQKRDQRRQRIAESRRRALAAVKAAGLRRILRLPEVEAATGKKRSAIYDGIADGTFPKPVPLGERAVGWIEDEVAAWQDARIAERDAKIIETAIERRLTERGSKSSVPPHRGRGGSRKNSDSESAP